MVNVVVTTKEIHRQLLEVVERNNQKIQGINQLPDLVRSQMDMQIFDDIDFLLRYITALHGVLEEAAKSPDDRSRKFKFE